MGEQCHADGQQTQQRSLRRVTGLVGRLEGGDALAYLARFRDVLQEGNLEQRKEFLRGFVHEISIDPDTARGVITFYELPISSLMMVPGARVALLKMIVSRNPDRFGLPEETWRVAA